MSPAGADSKTPALTVSIICAMARLKTALENSWWITGPCLIEILQNGAQANRAENFHCIGEAGQLPLSNARNRRVLRRFVFARRQPASNLARGSFLEDCFGEEIRR